MWEPFKAQIGSFVSMNWCLSHYGSRMVLLLSVRLFTVGIGSPVHWHSSCSVPSSCRCSSVFEATTPSLIKTFTPPRMWFSSACLLSTAMKEFIGLFWSLTAHRNEVSADFSPRRVKIREPDLSILTGNSCSILQRRRRRRKITCSFFVFLFFVSQTGQRLTARWING